MIDIDQIAARYPRDPRHRRRRVARFASFALLFACGAMAPATIWADDPPAEPKSPAPRSSLDQQLLDDLDNALLDGVEKKLPEKSKPPAKPDATKPDATKPDATKPDAKEPDAKEPDAKTTEADKLETGGAEQPGSPKKTDVPAPGKVADPSDTDTMGEDIGQGPEDPLTRIGRDMRRVEQLIAEQEAARREPQAAGADQMQEKIIKELADLISELEKQRKRQSNSNSKGKRSGQQPESAKREQVKQQRPASAKASSSPTDSSPELRDRAAQRPDAAQMQGMMKDLWGQLPAHARDQMLQTSPEQFLPRYELQLEKYYKRLAEQQKSSP